MLVLAKFFSSFSGKALTPFSFMYQNKRVCFTYSIIANRKYKKILETCFEMLRHFFRFAQKRQLMLSQNLKVNLRRG